MRNHLRRTDLDKHLAVENGETGFLAIVRRLDDRISKSDEQSERIARVRRESASSPLTISAPTEVPTEPPTSASGHQHHQAGADLRGPRAAECAGTPFSLHTGSSSDVLSHTEKSRPASPSSLGDRTSAPAAHQFTVNKVLTPQSTHPPVPTPPHPSTDRSTFTTASGSIGNISGTNCSAHRISSPEFEVILRAKEEVEVRLSKVSLRM